MFCMIRLLVPATPTIPRGGCFGGCALWRVEVAYRVISYLMHKASPVWPRYRRFRLQSTELLVKRLSCAKNLTFWYEAISSFVGNPFTVFTAMHL